MNLTADVVKLPPTTDVVNSRRRSIVGDEGSVGSVVEGSEEEEGSVKSLLKDINKRKEGM